MFSTHFALLACLCAALPPAVLARVAYVQPGHSISPDSRQRTHDGSVLGYDGRNDGHQMRALPPLLRRYDDHYGKNDHHDHGTLDDANHKTRRSRSPFARSRYRREPANFGRRYSVYFPGEDGHMYMVSRTPTTDGDHGGTGAAKRSSHAYVERQDDESNQVLGRIDIMVDTIRSGMTQRVASLTIDSTPIDWTSGQSSAKAFQLNASTTNQTQFIMLPAQDAAGSTDKHVLVTLATEVFNSSNAEMVMYCATYDPDPGTKSALVMMPCDTQSAIQLGNTDPCVNDGDDATTVNPHESQLFTYDPTTGQVAPIAATPSSSTTRRSEDDSVACAGARVRRNGRPPPTESSPTRLSSDPTGTKFASGTSGQARNVTLVYVATALEVPESSSNAPSSNTNITKASPGQAEDSTTTVTTTKTVTMTVSVSSSGQTGTPARAATSPTTTTGPLVNAKESLQVEIIGITGSAVTSSSLMTTTMTTTSTSTSTSLSSGSSASLEPQAIASMIANSRGHRRVR